MIPLFMVMGRGVGGEKTKYRESLTLGVQHITSCAHFTQLKLQKICNHHLTVPKTHYVCPMVLEPYRYTETIIAKLDVKSLCFHQPRKIIVYLFMVH